MNIHFYIILLFIGIAQGLFLVLLLLSKKENHAANLMLALLVLFYTLLIGQVVGFSFEIFKKVPHLITLFAGIPLIFGPLHYMYVRILVTGKRINVKTDFIHLAPYLINLGFYAKYFFQRPADLALDIIRFRTEPPPIFLFTVWTFTFQGLLYMFFSLMLIIGHSKKIKNEYSYIEKINLNWLNNITKLTLLVWIVVFINNLVNRFIVIPINNTEMPVALSFTILIYIMGYLGLNQAEIFTPSVGKDNSTNNENKILEKIASKKYEKSGLSEDKAKKYLKNLLKLMNEEKIYRESCLTLKDLAKKLSITSHNLSEIINTQLNQSFFELINSYRINDVKEAMTNPDKDNLTILALALDAGFNSKSSFNSLFKKHTNMTPSQYRKSINH